MHNLIPLLLHKTNKLVNILILKSKSIYLIHNFKICMKKVIKQFILYDFDFILIYKLFLNGHEINYFLIT